MERYGGDDRPKMGFSKWTLTVFAGVLLFVAALGFAANVEPAAEMLEIAGEPAREDEPAESSAPAELRETEPSPEPSELPEQTKYVATAIVAGGREYGVLVSREAAEMLVSELIAHYEQEATAELPEDFAGTIKSEFVGELEFVDAGEGAETESYAELLEEMLDRGRPKVRTVVSTVETETIAHKSKTEKDKYLVKGTRVVEALGKDGVAEIVVAAEYVNGRLEDETEAERTVLTEPVTALVREGSASAEDGEPGRREGRKGPDTELTFTEPIDGKVVLNYGQVDGVLHLGLDYEADEGENAVASADGRVVSVMERGGLGLVIELDHGDGFTTRYALLQSALVELGDTVRAGAAIGVPAAVGDGEALLHFELRADGEAYNPRFYLD